MDLAAWSIETSSAKVKQMPFPVGTLLEICSSDKIYDSMNKKDKPWQYLCSRNVINRKNWKVSRYAQNLHKRRLHYHDDLKDVVLLMARALILQDKVSEGEYAGVFCIV